jgi:hypothetical protein
MADQTAINAIKYTLPVEVDSIGLTDDLIGSIIDLKLSEAKTHLRVWRMFAGKVSTTIDVSESGTSRAQGVLFDRAKQMIDYWQTRSDVEDQQTEVLPARAHGASHTAVRI